MDGIVVIYKEKGYTSHDVVAKMRGILKQKKIGHTGTLDPDATGVLPLCLGKATKVCGLLADTDKTYQVVCRLGTVTDTQDATGKTLKRNEVRCSPDDVREAALSFLGEVDQLPPMYSAVKVGGKRLYELARQGKTVEREPRKVTFYRIELLEVDVSLGLVKLEVECSKGTYIRTLCHDIGKKLGCGACMEELVRTKAGRFTIGEAITLEEVEEAVSLEIFSERVIPIDAVFSPLPAVFVLNARLKAVRNGGRFYQEHTRGETSEPHLPYGQKVRAYDDGGSFIGVYEYLGEEGFRLLQLFI